jgi:hypothetical protein
VFEVQILVPIADNDHREFESGQHELFEAVVLEKFGGVSRLPGAAEGKWIDQGRIYADQLRVYVVAMMSITQGRSLFEVVEFAKRHYRQEAIYVRDLGQSEIL